VPSQIENGDTVTPMRGLSQYWADFFDQCEQRPYIHPRDAECFGVEYWKRKPSCVQESLDFRGFIKSPRLDPDDADFHFSLLPAPYVGNLAKADVFILLLNAGFSPGDYFAEYEREDFKKALKQNLRQEFSGVECPFLFLDPRFCWRPGYQWWEKKLRRILQVVARKKFEGDYLRALRYVSRRIASIDLVPYHSRKFNAGQLAEMLNSAQAARAWVDHLVRRARDRRIVIVATYKWRLKNQRNRVVCVEKGAALGFHLTPKTKPGKLILKRLLKKKS
jgi:hypothetical protein